MKIYGIDFTSRPKRRKPLTSLNCTFNGHVLCAGNLEEWRDFSEFEQARKRPGPWFARIDFPFDQSRKFIETICWPAIWSDYVMHAQSLGRNGLRDALNAYRQTRESGDKKHR